MFVDAISDARGADDEEPPREIMELSALEEPHESGEGEESDDETNGGAEEIEFDMRNVFEKLTETRRARFLEELDNLEY